MGTLVRKKLRKTLTLDGFSDGLGVGFLEGDYKDKNVGCWGWRNPLDDRK